MDVKSLGIGILADSHHLGVWPWDQAISFKKLRSQKVVTSENFGKPLHGHAGRNHRSLHFTGKSQLSKKVYRNVVLFQIMYDVIMQSYYLIPVNSSRSSSSLVPVKIAPHPWKKSLLHHSLDLRRLDQRMMGDRTLSSRMLGPSYRSPFHPLPRQESRVQVIFF